MVYRSVGQSLLARRWHRYGRTGGRFLLVSAFNVVCGQALLVLAHAVFAWTFAAANLFAVAVSTGPAYLLTRYWAWEKRSPNHVAREILPFWGLAFLGLGVSTGAVSLANRYSEAQLVLNAVNLAAFGALWLFKFFLFDRCMFGTQASRCEAVEAADTPKPTYRE